MPLVRGFLIGLSVAVPVGPIGVLCIRRSVTLGRRAGLATGLGAATADALYAGVAAFGLTAVAGALVDNARPVRLAAAAVLAAMAVHALARPPSRREQGGAPPSLPALYAGTVGLTLGNPTTIVSFAAIFAGVGVAAGSPAGAAALTGGVFAGSAAWWLVLSAVSARASALLGRRKAWLDRSTAIVLGLFAVAAFAAALRA